MSNGEVKEHNKGYVFTGYFDATLFGILSGFFPVLSIIVEYNHISVIGVETVYDLVFTETLLVATLFYEFYSRFKDCDWQTPFVILVLCIGRGLFFALSIVCFVIMFLVSKGVMGEDVERALRIIMYMSLYPTLISVFELLVRSYRECQRKITKNKN